MRAINSKVDTYLIDGCKRCKYGATPACKVNKWRMELELLRQILLETDLVEDLKWGMPCYTWNKKNIVMLAAFKEYCCISFFKGVLLTDTNKKLTQHGENSQTIRIIKITHVSQIENQKESIQQFIKEAILIEKSGKKIEPQKSPEIIPDELNEAFKHSPELKNAFYKLTPGRQRGYILYIGQAKLSQSKINRIEKCKENIFKGIGLHDKYKC